jgi:hypothetical protein
MVTSILTLFSGSGVDEPMLYEDFDEKERLDGDNEG